LQIIYTLLLLYLLLLQPEALSGMLLLLLCMLLLQPEALSGMLLLQLEALNVEGRR